MQTDYGTTAELADAIARGGWTGYRSAPAGSAGSAIIVEGGPRVRVETYVPACRAYAVDSRVVVRAYVGGYEHVARRIMPPDLAVAIAEVVAEVQASLDGHDRAV